MLCAVIEPCYSLQIILSDHCEKFWIFVIILAFKYNIFILLFYRFMLICFINYHLNIVYVNM